VSSVPYIVLGTFKPKTWKSWDIGKRLTDFTKESGLVPHVDPVHGAQTWVPWYDEALHAEVRIWTEKNRQGCDWHKDGDTTSGARMDCAIVLWADWAPTEFQYAGKISQPRPYEVVLFRNLAPSHRRPPHIKAEAERWVFRQRCRVPEHILLP